LEGKDTKGVTAEKEGLKLGDNDGEKGEEGPAWEGEGCEPR